jgi:hypothetical protein
MLIFCGMMSVRMRIMVTTVNMIQSWRDWQKNERRKMWREWNRSRCAHRLMQLIKAQNGALRTALRPYRSSITLIKKSAKNHSLGKISGK